MKTNNQNNENANEVMNIQNSNEMKKKNVEVATPNATEIDNVATEATSNEYNKNFDNMIYSMNLAGVCGEESVAQTATVDQQVVNDLFNAFMAIPQEVVVRFKNEDGYLKMIVNMNHREKFFHSYETYADGKLVENMVGSMRGDRIASLEIYKSEEHPLSPSESDPRIDIFRQFIDSPLRCHFEADFVANNGDRYVCATFNISFRKQIKFCLKRTEEVEAIINEAIQAA